MCDTYIHMDDWAAWLTRITGGDSQSAIAEKIGVSRSTVARWGVRKVIDPEMVLKLARAYKVDPVEGLVAGGWLRLEDITVGGLRTIISLSPSLLLVEELYHRSVAAEDARRNKKTARPKHHLFDHLLDA